MANENFALTQTKTVPSRRDSWNSPRAAPVPALPCRAFPSRPERAGAFLKPKYRRTGSEASTQKSAPGKRFGFSWRLMA